MTTTRITCLYLLLGLMSAHSLSAQADCKAVFDAVKIPKVPTHIYSTMNFSGTDTLVETIYLGDAIYTRMSGKWSRSPMTAQEMTQLQQKNLQTDKATCKYLKDEAVNGEMAAVYTTHDVSPKGVTDSQLWISKSKKLPLRHEVDVEVGAGKNKSHMSSRYEYGNVKAPI